jgi:predicted ester cyclase
MSPDEIEIRYCQFVEDVLNHGHLDALPTYMTADVVSHAPGVASGCAGARRFIETLVSAFPDFHCTIDAVAAADDELVARLTVTGTHSGTLLGLLPTGRRVRVSAFGAWQLREGQCAEQWLQLDMPGLLQQLGAELTASSPRR